MYTFVDQLHRHRRTILCLTFFAVCLLARTEAESESVSALISSSDSDGLLGCSYRGTIMFHGDQLVIDACTTCVCDNSTVKCDIKSCQPVFCDDPITGPEECCYLCPYSAQVWQVNPRHIDVIREGVVYHVTIDLNIKIKDHGQGVAGEDLCKVSMWGSANSDGSGDRVGYVEQVLTEGQATQGAQSPTIAFGDPEFTIQGIEYTMDSQGSTCSDMVYLCVKFAKGANPSPSYLPFDVKGVESETDDTSNSQHLIGCEIFPNCEA
ncbi:uncharacterized protein [Amphiura filiformis]|uniref:uncharacterized protein n=1 Tax=Amphiura filiformis TaxID=82378 RepID=UPI003B217BF9